MSLNKSKIGDLIFFAKFVWMVYPLCLCGTGCMMLAHKSVLTQAVKANYVEKRLCYY